MRNQTRNIAFLLALCALGCAGLWRNHAHADAAEDDGVLLIGIDSMKNSVTTRIPAAMYRRSLAAAVSSVHDSMLPALNAPGAIPRRAWTMNTIGVGLGLVGQVGLGPLLELTLAAKLRLIFSRSAAPEYPDL